MQVLLLTLLGPAVILAVRRMAFLRRCGCPLPARRLYRRASWSLGAGLLSAMALQELLLLGAGQLTWRSGLPLHLCSLMGLLTLPMLLAERPLLWHLSLYAGMPGALLALLFPAVAQTPWPRLTALAFHLMHTLLLLAPLLPLGLGRRPEPRGALHAWGLLLLLALPIMAVNRLLGSNYLFLAFPVPGTPLTALARGPVPYPLALLMLSALVLSAEGGVIALISRHRPALPARSRR